MQSTEEATSKHVKRDERDAILLPTRSCDHWKYFFLFSRIDLFSVTTTNALQSERGRLLTDPKLGFFVSAEVLF